MRHDRLWENALLRTSSRKEPLEHNLCWSCSSQSLASLPLDLPLHSPPSIGTSPTFKQVGESRRGIWFWTGALPGTVRSMWRTTVRGLFALLGQQPWHQQHQQQQQHLLGAGILITALTQLLLVRSFTVGPSFGSACQSLSPVDNSVDRLLLPI